MSKTETIQTMEKQDVRAFLHQQIDRMLDRDGSAKLEVGMGYERLVIEVEWDIFVLDLGGNEGNEVAERAVQSSADIGQDPDLSAWPFSEFRCHVSDSVEDSVIYVMNQARELRDVEVVKLGLSEMLETGRWTIELRGKGDIDIPNDPTYNESGSGNPGALGDSS